MKRNQNPELVLFATAWDPERNKINLFNPLTTISHLLLNSNFSRFHTKKLGNCLIPAGSKLGFYINSSRLNLNIPEHILHLQGS